MSLLGGLLDQYIQPILGLRATQYTIVACASLWAYDLLLTLDREVYFVWGSKLTAGKILFFLNRYSPILDSTLTIYILHGVKDERLCPALAKIAGWSFVVGLFISESILAMRTWAIWGGRRWVLIFLVVFSAAIVASAVFLTNDYLSTLQFISIPSFIRPALSITCAPLPVHGKTGLEFMVFMVNQTVIAALTLFRAIRQYRMSKNPILKMMFQDGILYFLYTLAFAIANVVVALVLPIQYEELLELPLRVISSICCSRVLLNIRAAYFKGPDISVFEMVQGIKTPSSHMASSSIAASSTLGPSDLGHGSNYREPQKSGWKWEDQTKSPRLSLGRISPFQWEVTDYRHDSRNEIVELHDIP